MLASAKLGNRLVRAGCDGWHVTAKLNPVQAFSADDDDPERGYRTPSWVGTSALAAALAVTAPIRPYLAASGNLGETIDVIQLTTSDKLDKAIKGLETSATVNATRTKAKAAVRAAEQQVVRAAREAQEGEIIPHA